MSSSPPDSTIITTLIASVAASFTALIGWIGSRQVNRLDSHEERLTVVENKQTDTAQVKQSIDKLDKNIDKVHSRIDEIWKHLAE